MLTNLAYSFDIAPGYDLVRTKCIGGRHYFVGIRGQGRAHGLKYIEIDLYTCAPSLVLMQYL